MANYLLVYHGGSQPETPEAGQAVMAAWTAWFDRLGPCVVDAGDATSHTKVIAANGSVTDGGPTSPTGYSVLTANSLDAAVALAKGCPQLAAGGSIEVSETMDIM